MSLFTPESLIRKSILEAEDLTLNPSSDAQVAQDFTSASSPMDVAANMAQAAPMQQQDPGLQGSTLSMPAVVAPQATISKIVINKNIVLSQLRELKAVITNLEKAFDGDDLTPEQSNVMLSGLLSTLSFHAEKFNTFMESSPVEEPAMPDVMGQVVEQPLELQNTVA